MPHYYARKAPFHNMRFTKHMVMNGLIRLLSRKMIKLVLEWSLCTQDHNETTYKKIGADPPLKLFFKTFQLFIKNLICCVVCCLIFLEPFIIVEYLKAQGLKPPFTVGQIYRKCAIHISQHVTIILGNLNSIFLFFHMPSTL